ncbi:MAG TPA: hypothetical protein PKD53_31245 [Chloroflexaceae bacterium]|nr:hypothetical protein [Chloroflexaceae bacterium]
MLMTILARLGRLRRGRGGGQGGAAAPLPTHPGPVAHAFAADALSVKALVPAGTDGLALFRPTMPGAYTLSCAPRYAKAGGRGMRETPGGEP